MKGGPMFTMKNGFKNKKAGLFLGILSLSSLSLLPSVSAT